jgi:hypothetical protein
LALSDSCKITITAGDILNTLENAAGTLDRKWGIFMRRTSLLFAAACIVGSTQLSYGADLPVKAPVYKAPPIVLYNWTGC